MKLGVFGGTFNPPHLGHLEAARTAVAALGLDKLLIVPAAIPPHKALPEETPSQEHRLAMAERLADSLLMPGVAEVSAIELERPGKSYTADTLAQLHGQYPDAQLWLLMGTDMFLTLHQWRGPERILELAGVCAFGRTAEDGEAAFAPQLERLSQAFPGARLTTLTLPGLVDISSTQLRELLAKGEGAQELLPPRVYGYILLNGLYGVRADLTRLTDAQLRAASCSMMRAKRIAHVAGAEEEAAKLARRWGADETQARRAAILHDCTKYLSPEEHFELCQRYGVALDEIERAGEKLLHAKTGAAIAKHVFGEPPAVCGAICFHTTGKADMSLLEKILYIADYMEPNRDFPGVEELRRLAYENLDEAVILGCEMSVAEMAEKKREIHPNTLAALAYLKGMRP